MPGRGWRDDHSIKRLTAIELVFDNGGVVLNGRAIPRGVDGGDVRKMSDVLTSIGVGRYGTGGENRARTTLAAGREDER